MQRWGYRADIARSMAFTVLLRAEIGTVVDKENLLSEESLRKMVIVSGSLSSALEALATSDGDEGGAPSAGGDVACASQMYM